MLNDIRKLEPLARKVMPMPEKIYAATKRANTPEGVEKYFSDFKAFIGTLSKRCPGLGGATIQARRDT